MIENKLLRAVLTRNIIQVQGCIEEGEDPYYKDDEGRSYLHLSVFLRCNELVKYFLNVKGIDVNTRDRDNVTPLHRACRSGCESIVELLLLHGADPNAEAKDSITPLHIAAAFGHTECIRVLCTKSTIPVDVNARDDRHHTPLHFAAAEGHVSTASTLIISGCDVNAENIAGNRPLHFAVTSRNPELCQVLLQASAYIDAQNYNSQTALHFATQEACINAVVYLLNSKADPNVRDINGSTCSHLAIRMGHTELVKIFMMDPRTDPTISDDQYDTVLHVALKLGHFNLIPMMLPRARDLTKQDGSGNSVIIEAIKSQLEDLAIQMLKACPSLVHTATHDLVTPLHLAAERGMKKLTKQLLISGAQVDAADSSGLTPSLYCAKNDSVLECLAMIEDIMMITDNHIVGDDEEPQQHVKGNGSNLSRISS